MAILRAFKPLVASCSGILLAACSYANAVPQAVAIAQASPAAAQPGGLLTIAGELAAKGDHEGAIPLYRHAAATTRSPEALTGLADSLLAMGNLEAAFRILGDLIADTPEMLSGTTYYSYGKAALALGNFSSALDGFSQAVLLMPGDPRPKSGKAIALAATGKTFKALQTLHGASDPSSLSNKALVLAATGNPGAAINILEPLLRGGSGKARDRQNLAMAYLLDGQEDRAFQVARLDLDGDSVNETFTFYRSLASLGRAERMQALVTGTIDPEWTKAQVANLSLEESKDRQVAAQRMVAKKPAPMVAAATIEPEPEPKKPEPKKVTPANYMPGDIPPLLEPEGWALQIGAYRTLKRLTDGWGILYERNIDILKDIPPRRSEMDFGTRTDGPSGFYFRLNAGPLKTLTEAKTLCTELRKRGTSCWIRPPETSEGKLPAAQKAEKTKDTQIAEKPEKAEKVEKTGETQPAQGQTQKAQTKSR